MSAVKIIRPTFVENDSLSSSNGFRLTCQESLKGYVKLSNKQREQNYKIKDKDNHKFYKEINKDQIKHQNKNYQEKNKDLINQKSKEY